MVSSLLKPLHPHPAVPFGFDNSFRESINMRGKPAKEYLKTVAYSGAIEEFKATLAEIGKAQGWTLGDIKSRFSNELWDYMIYA
jgi:hypothetical protein